MEITLDCEEVDMENLVSEGIRKLEGNYNNLEEQRRKNQGIYKLKLKNLEENRRFGFNLDSQIEWDIKQELRNRAEKIETKPLYKKLGKYYKERFVDPVRRSNSLSHALRLLSKKCIPSGISGACSLMAHNSLHSLDSMEIGSSFLLGSLFEDGLSLYTNIKDKKRKSQRYKDLANYLKVEIK